MLNPATLLTSRTIRMPEFSNDFESSDRERGFSSKFLLPPSTHRKYDDILLTATKINRFGRFWSLLYLAEYVDFFTITNFQNNYSREEKFAKKKISLKSNRIIAIDDSAPQSTDDQFAASRTTGPMNGPPGGQVSPYPQPPAFPALQSKIAAAKDFSAMRRKAAEIDFVE
ncbi:unnamed protein product [Nesidiocoris tenuis]|uniref:Uncharacterized protein n=1 Tax=Nesidiocoris tenuis TaxID=355587 RepID=A0A6H5HJX9_9HEMI|nr:unnamed protein product [Nesidiocoris tenuis]